MHFAASQILWPVGIEPAVKHIMTRSQSRLTFAAPTGPWSSTATISDFNVDNFLSSASSSLSVI